jgi:hypothetical protein
LAVVGEEDAELEEIEEIAMFWGVSLSPRDLAIAFLIWTVQPSNYLILLCDEMSSSMDCLTFANNHPIYS